MADEIVLVKGRVDHKEAGSTCLVVQSVQRFAPSAEEIERAGAKAKAAAAAARAQARPVHLRVNASELRRRGDRRPQAGDRGLPGGRRGARRDRDGQRAAAAAAARRGLPCRPHADADGRARERARQMRAHAARGARGLAQRLRRRRAASPRSRSFTASSTSLRGGPSRFSPGVSSTQASRWMPGSGEERRAAALAELPGADVRVPVAVGAERRLRVVEVQRADPPGPQLAARLAQHRVRSLRGADVIAAREQMAGVQADTEPLRAARRLDQLRELREGAPQRAARPGRVLEVELGAVAVGERLGDRLAGSRDRRRRRGPAWRSPRAARPRRRSRGRRAASGSATPAIWRGSRRSSLAQLTRYTAWISTALIGLAAIASRNASKSSSP